MEQLIDLCPPSLTLVLSTRVDPPFRLGRLRVRNRITEVRADDLRFATGEATSLLGAVERDPLARAARRAVRPDGGVGRRAGVGRALAGAGTRSGQVRRGVRRRRSARRQLPQRRAARGDVSRRPAASPGDVGARSAHRPTGRRGDRAIGRARVADGHRRPEPARHPAGQHRRVVPLPPPPARSAPARSAPHLPRTDPRTAASRRGVVRIAERPGARGRAPPRRRRHSRRRWI